MKSWRQKQLGSGDDLSNDRPSRGAKLNRSLAGTQSSLAQKIKNLFGFGARSRAGVEERLRASWPTIHKTVLESAVDLARTAAQNDVELRKLFESVYRKLPPKMRRWVSSEQFVRFCFQNRDRLLDRTQATPAIPVANSQQIKP